MRLSSAQRQILATVGTQADLEIPEVAKRCRLRTHTARYAIESMYERGIIKKIWTIDTFKLGFSRYNIFFSTGVPKKALREKLLAAIQNYKMCVFLVELGGNFDYEVSLLVRRGKEVLDFFNEITREFGPIFTNKQIEARTGISLFPRKYLGTGIKSFPYLTFPATLDEVEVDEFENALLIELAKEGRSPLREIARKLGASASRTEYHFRRLRESGVIAGCVYGVNNAGYGATSYELHLFCKGFDDTLKKRLFEFARRHPNCTHFLDALGNADYEIGAEVLQYSDLTLLREELGEQFGSEITRIEVFARLGIRKYVPYPLFMPAK